MYKNSGAEAPGVPSRSCSFGGWPFYKNPEWPVNVFCGGLMPPLCQTTPLSTPVMASNVPIEYSHQRRMNISISTPNHSHNLLTFLVELFFAMLLRPARRWLESLTMSRRSSSYFCLFLP